MQSMTEDDSARAINELDRLLNDPDVPLQPALIWQILAKVSEQGPPGGAMLSQIMTMTDQKGDQMRASIVYSTREKAEAAADSWIHLDEDWAPRA
jgi:hypothetical protein